MVEKKPKSSYRDTVQKSVAFPMALILLLPMSVVDAAISPEGFEMFVRPRLCVLRPGEALCTMQFSVTWSAPLASDVCVQLVGDAAPLRCWQAQRSGEFAIPIERGNTTLVQLRESSSDSLLIEEQIPIIKRDLRDTRARRRHAWSIL